MNALLALCVLTLLVCQSAAQQVSVAFTIVLPNTTYVSSATQQHSPTIRSAPTLMLREAGLTVWQ